MAGKPGVAWPRPAAAESRVAWSAALGVVAALRWVAGVSRPAGRALVGVSGSKYAVAGACGVAPEPLSGPDSWALVSAVGSTKGAAWFGSCALVFSSGLVGSHRGVTLPVSRCVAPPL